MMRTFRLQLRFLLPLVVILTVAAYLALPVMDRLTLRWFARDLTLRGELVANALSESVADALQDSRGRKLQALFDRALQDERMVAIGWCSTGGQLLRRTQAFPKDFTCAQATELAAAKEPSLRIEGGPVHVTMHPVTAESGPVGHLVLMHDLSFIERRSQDTRQYLIILIASLGIVIAFVTVVVAQLSWRGWVSGARALLRGEGLVRPMLPASPELAPLAAELRERLRELEDEYRRVQGPETGWSPERLQSLLRTQLRGDQVIVVSNREPYIHEHKDGKVVVRRPASGLVTAVEPVMRACSGTWVAHGAGSADRENVDGHDRVALPPGHSEYQLRRLWLTEEQEQGYY
ncbi:MAG: trehalose-6-phosphate synthase, partial [Comamonadaceae bacterium]